MQLMKFLAPTAGLALAGLSSFAFAADRVVTKDPADPVGYVLEKEGLSGSSSPENVSYTESRVIIVQPDPADSPTGDPALSWLVYRPQPLREGLSQ